MKGNKGDQGVPGEKGDQGVPGMKGNKGDQGVPGEKGDQGVPGMKGNKGDQGVPGEKGDQGVPGMKGNKGDQGVPGMKGNKGDQGPPGDNCANTVRVHDTGGNGWSGTTSGSAPGHHFIVEAFPLVGNPPTHFPNQPVVGGPSGNTYDENRNMPTDTNLREGLDVSVPQLPGSAPQP